MARLKSCPDTCLAEDWSKGRRRGNRRISPRLEIKKPTPTLFSVLKAPNKLNQAAHTDSGWAFGDPGFVVFYPCCACDIEVQPGRVVNEFFQEDGRGAGSAPASAGIHDVGDARTDLVKIFLVERQAPEFFSGPLQCSGEVLISVLIVGKDTGVVITQGDDACASKSCGVDQVSTTESAGVIEAVSQHKSAFSISINDLNGFAGHGNLHITRLLGFTAGHIF